MADYVPDGLTPYSFDEAREGMSWALGNVLMRSPSLDTLALALSKSALETGRWRAIHRHNVGNTKCPIETPAQDYTVFGCNELLPRGGKTVVVWFSPVAETVGKNGPTVGQIYELPPGHPQCRFTAHANRYDGFDYYVNFLAKRARYAKAFQALLAGSPEAFVRALAASGYFTAPVEQYLATVMSLFREFRAKLQGSPHEDTPLPESKWEWHNQLLLDGFARTEYDRLLDGPSLGGGRALLEHERASEAEGDGADPDKLA